MHEYALGQLAAWRFLTLQLKIVVGVGERKTRFLVGSTQGSDMATENLQSQRRDLLCQCDRVHYRAKLREMGPRLVYASPECLRRNRAVI